MYLDDIKERMNLKDKYLSKYACLDNDAIRFNENDSLDIRTEFLRDSDRILYSLSYLRYMDKTQVFSNISNDNVSKRMSHVQMVSKVARTIGRALGLNEDLIEAASLGHDLGHVPFGHTGERILNKISLENNEGYFNHNVQSVRTLMNLESNGKGENITLQVLDAIICHNGELELREYKPKTKTKEDFIREYNLTYTDPEMNYKLIPMTLEGCVVRISDIIAYIGKDVDDALRMGLIKNEDIPTNVKKVLGNKNGQIINTIMMDILKNSIDKNHICLSEDVFNAIKELKEFNYKYIYNKANTKEDIELYEKMFREVFDECLKDIKNNTTTTRIFPIYLNEMNDTYINNTSDERKVIDYIAGMTDDYLVSEYNIIRGVNNEKN